ncbi:putative ferric-chelate reductase 1 [Babylonia areolata]|uniref:putative ferric-chelate reductase 1 n=1 Tax=Babylonia areolata TaxID=304850 RepID=UPI003FCF5366
MLLLLVIRNGSAYIPAAASIPRPQYRDYDSLSVGVDGGIRDSVLRKSSECSESLGCITNPEATVMLTWQPTSQHVHFTLRGYIGSGELYVAVGLSGDEVMGEDDVTECVFTGGTVRVMSSYNSGKSNARYSDGGLSNRTGVYESGTLQCSFSRSVAGDDGQQGGGGVGGPPARHDLTFPWHIMLVWGQLVPGTDRKQQHTYRSVSSHKVSLRAVGSFETQKLSDALIHAHGCLMMIAWLTVTSIGVIIARHYKGLLQGTQLRGKDVWFQVHRVLMALCVLLTVSGVVIIFVEVGGYREITSRTDMFSLMHPILGLIVTALAILNPIIALFRPTPSSLRRPVFNWVHRCIGTGAHIIGGKEFAARPFRMVTIVFGMLLKKVLAPMSMLFALGGFVVWHVTMETIFFCIVFSRKQKNENKRHSSRSYAVQDKQDTVDDNRQRPVKVSVFQEILLMMHSAVAIATTIFLITVFLSKHEH